MRSQPRRQRPANPGRLAWLLIPLVLVVWIVWWQWDAIERLWNPAPSEQDVGTIDESRSSDREPDPGDTPEIESGGEAERRWTELLGAPPVWPADLREPSDCEDAEAGLARICAALDSSELLQSARAEGGACGLLREVAETLAARPPVLSSELRSHQAILSNVFHLFRTLGRQRIELLHAALTDESDLAEPAGMALYRWLVTRDACARSGETAIRLEPLYDYSGFLFQTIGGQAYLRRREPRIEALVSFYAVMLIDRADERGHNPDGVDLRPEISRTRALIEAQPLVFRTGYLNVLDAVDERWKNK